MTPKIKERLLNGAISALTAGGAVILAFALSSGEAKSLSLKKEIREKAPYEYVDKQDDAIKQDLSEYKDTHALEHTREINSFYREIESVQKQLDIVVKWVESQ